MTDFMAVAKSLGYIDGVHGHTQTPWHLTIDSSVPVHLRWQVAESYSNGYKEGCAERKKHPQVYGGN